MWIVAEERAYYPEIHEFKSEDEAWKYFQHMEVDNDEKYYLAYVVRRKLK